MLQTIKVVCFFIYGHDGTGKTYLYCTIAAKLGSEGKIVLIITFSGKYSNNPFNYQFQYTNLDFKIFQLPYFKLNLLINIDTYTQI